MSPTRSPPMIRKPKAKRNEIKVNYRLAPEVKSGVARTAEIARRSENLHAEYLLRLGLLVIKGVDATKLTDEEIFKEFSKLYENEEAKDSEENKK